MRISYTSSNKESYLMSIPKSVMYLTSIVVCAFVLLVVLVSITTTLSDNAEVKRASAELGASITIIEHNLSGTDQCAHVDVELITALRLAAGALSKLEVLGSNQNYMKLRIRKQTSSTSGSVASYPLHSHRSISTLRVRALEYEQFELSGKNACWNGLYKKVTGAKTWDT